MQSALFASLIMQQHNLALMLLGKAPHPGTGETTVDPEGARVMIDQVEMLEAKTQGNLDENEARFLKDVLMQLRMAFVEAVENQAKPKPAPTDLDSSKTSAPAREDLKAPEESSAASSSAGSDEGRKKFSKKY